ncbi:O-antigen ligase family protein [Streptomyces hoynatensis]|uniref:O-antigen ligase family protein n=1 Tax=Streptomyces hoynatensis TaxID=1141874 RepID=UPI001F4D5DAC|nr:O-antigen ligase family protein [Streptomyces hoynatensis]
MALAPARARLPWTPRWPAAATLGTVLLLLLPAGRVSVAGGRIVAADLASLALAAACAVRLARGHRPPLTWPAAAVLGAPAVVLAAATVAAADPWAALPGYLRFLQTFVLVPAALVLLLRDARDVRLVAGGLVVLALGQGLVGTVQYLTGTGASYMGQNVRAVGTFGPQHVMGMATAVSLGLIAALSLALAPPPGARRAWRAAALASVAFLAVPLTFSFSRGAWLAAAVAVLALLLLRLSFLGRARLALGGACLALTGAVVLGAGAVGPGLPGAGLVGDRLSSIGEVADAPDQSVIDRYAMWDAALAIWRERPWTGAGPRGFAALRDSHASLALSSGGDVAGAGLEFRRQELLSPHNMYLLVLGEQGLAGAATLIGCWAALLVCCLLRLRACRRGRDLGLLATGLLLWHAVDFLYADVGGPTTVLTAVAFGLTAWWALAPAAEPEGAR